MTQEIKELVREVLNDVARDWLSQIIADVLKDQVREIVAFQIYQSSAINKIIKPNYPWIELEIGQSFAVNKDIVKGATLRNKASDVGRKLDKRFTVKAHETVYEVARIK